MWRKNTKTPTSACVQYLPDIHKNSLKYLTLIAIRLKRITERIEGHGTLFVINCDHNSVRQKAERPGEVQ